MCPWFSQGWILTVVWQLEAETVSSREGVTPRQAGTWDPTLQCLHLDVHLLFPSSNRIQRSYKELKITSCMHRWGKL